MDIKEIKSELEKLEKKDKDLCKDFWKWYVLDQLQFNAETENADIEYDMNINDVDEIAEKLANNDSLYDDIDLTVLDLLRVYKKKGEK